MADYSWYRTETLEKMRSAAREKYYNERFCNFQP